MRPIPDRALLGLAAGLSCPAIPWPVVDGHDVLPLCVALAPCMVTTSRCQPAGAEEGDGEPGLVCRGVGMCMWVAAAVGAVVTTPNFIGVQGTRDERLTTTLVSTGAAVPEWSSHLSTQIGWPPRPLRRAGPAWRLSSHRLVCWPDGSDQIARRRLRRTAVGHGRDTCGVGLERWRHNRFVVSPSRMRTVGHRATAGGVGG